MQIYLPSQPSRSQSIVCVQPCDDVTPATYKSVAPLLNHVHVLRNPSFSSTNSGRRPCTPPDAAVVTWSRAPALHLLFRQKTQNNRVKLNTIIKLSYATRNNISKHTTSRLSHARCQQLTNAGVFGLLHCTIVEPLRGKDRTPSSVKLAASALYIDGSLLLFAYIR